MCGIFGFTSQIDNPQKLLRNMGNAIIHRGPDGDGYFLDDNVSMGMRRLSIIDVEKGNQPFFNASKNIVVMCNGEIYNYKTLREELSGEGVKFNTDSDVEVLPHLYERDGIEFVNKLNGIYAIVVYDSVKNQIYLVRDRLGVKPLYYAVVDNNLIYASELKSLLKLPDFYPEVDYDAISSYLDLKYIPRPLSPFKQIKKLDSGSYLSWIGNTTSIKRYWSLSLSTTPINSEEAVMDKIDEILNDSVKMELNSDVPIGSFLSGGIDSSVVTKLASNLTKEEFSVFHMRWKEVKGKIDESEYAEKVIEKSTVNKYFREVRQINVISLLPKLIYHLDEPFADAAFIPTYYLANIASENVKVILSGAGGDELFGGYPHYYEYSRFKSLINKLIGRKALAHSYYDMWRSDFRNDWKKLFPWYKPSVMKKEFEEKWQNNKDTDYINSIMLNDIEYYLQDDILFLTDKMTMAASIECRVPILDHRLVELSQKIPSNLKIKGKERKYIFKKWALKYLPPEILYRQKEGFGFPIEIWINDYKEIYFDLLLENGYMVSNNLISIKELQKLLLKTELNRVESWYYWQILVLEIWLQIFILQTPVDEVFNLK